MGDQFVQVPEVRVSAPLNQLLNYACRYASYLLSIYLLVQHQLGLLCMYVCCPPNYLLGACTRCLHHPCCPVQYIFWTRGTHKCPPTSVWWRNVYNLEYPALFRIIWMPSNMSFTLKKGFTSTKTGAYQRIAPQSWVS